MVEGRNKLVFGEGTVGEKGTAQRVREEVVKRSLESVETEESAGGE